MYVCTCVYVRVWIARRATHVVAFATCIFCRGVAEHGCCCWLAPLWSVADWLTGWLVCLLRIRLYVCMKQGSVDERARDTVALHLRIVPIVVRYRPHPRMGIGKARARHVTTIRHDRNWWGAKKKMSCMPSREAPHSWVLI